MGNCLTSNYRVTAEEDDTYDHNDHSKARHDGQEIIPEQQILKLSGSKKGASGGEKKIVEFKLRQEENTNGAGKSENGVVRVRIVMTREELKQIVSCSCKEEEEEEESCTIERLVSELKHLRERGKICEGESTSNEGFVNGGWRPTLESIPEEYHGGVHL